MSNILRCIHGHTSPETAYEFQDWPSGYRGRCRRRVYLEFKKGHGFRFVSQTTDFKDSNDWNKPHASTYHQVGVLVWTKCDKSPTGESLSWAGLSLYCDTAACAKFEKDYAEAVAADENLRRELNGIKLLCRVRDANAKLQRIFENVTKHLEGGFRCEEFVALFEGDNAFGNAIADKWMRQTEGVGVIKDWVRNQFKVFMVEYQAGFTLAKELKPEGFKMLSPRMDTVQDGDYAMHEGAWFAVSLVSVGEIIQSHGYYCRRRES